MMEYVKELAPLGVGGILGAFIYVHSWGTLVRLLSESEKRTDAVITVVKESVAASKETTVAVSILTEVVRSSHGQSIPPFYKSQT